MRRSHTSRLSLLQSGLPFSFSPSSSSPVSFSTLWIPIRCFQTIQKGYDVPVASLYAILGLEDPKKSRHRGNKLGEGGVAYDDRILYSTEKELTQAFLLQVSLLKDPERNKAEKKRLQELKTALQLLLDPRYRAQYRSHYSCSVDAKLGILLDGGEVGANYNSEHRQFFFFDHSKPVEATQDEGLLDGLPLLNGKAGCTFQERNEDTVDGRDDRYRGTSSSQATQQGSTAVREESTTTSTSAFSSPPRRGGDISVTLRLSFEEGWRGGSRVILLPEKEVRCRRCHGTGKEGGGESGGIEEDPLPGKSKNDKSTPLRVGKGTGGKKRCPQCFGRGHVVLPSATYYIHRPCTYCMGEGIAPPRPCRTCQGRGVVVCRSLVTPLYSNTSTAGGGPPSGLSSRGVKNGEEQSGGYHLVIHIPPFTTAPVTSFRLHGKGHCGRYGGPAGDVLLTVLVAEHRYFYYQPVPHSTFEKDDGPASQKSSHITDVCHRWHIVLPISLTTALLGGRATVPHPGEMKVHKGRETWADVSSPSKGRVVVVQVPPGTFNGYQIHVPLGTAGEHTSGTSSSQLLIVHMLVMVPKGFTLTARQQRALRVYDEEELQKQHASPVGEVPSWPASQDEEKIREHSGEEEQRTTMTSRGNGLSSTSQVSSLEASRKREKSKGNGSRGKREQRVKQEENKECIEKSQDRKIWNDRKNEGGQAQRCIQSGKTTGRAIPLRKVKSTEKKTTHQATGSAWGEEDSARLWEECAELKSKYRHWLQVP